MPPSYHPLLSNADGSWPLLSDVSGTLSDVYWSSVHGTYDIMCDQVFITRCKISCVVAFVMYTTFGFFVNLYFGRRVDNSVNSKRPPVFDLFDIRSDYTLALVSLIAGTPMVQFFHHASDLYGRGSGLFLYNTLASDERFGHYGWAWELVQIPVYLFLWDSVFYVLHRWVLHSSLGYKYSHINHHAFRPPTGWSGIAIDPFEVVMSGTAPYLVPLFFGLPFNEITVFVVNTMLMLHAVLLHSNCHAKYPGWIGKYVLISPIGHNRHHHYGEHNASNFAPIFKFWDIVFGTLSEDDPFWWKSDVPCNAAIADLRYGKTWKRIFGFYPPVGDEKKKKKAEAKTAEVPLGALTTTEAEATTTPAKPRGRPPKAATPAAKESAEKPKQQRKASRSKSATRGKANDKKVK